MSIQDRRFLYFKLFKSSLVILQQILFSGKNGITNLDNMIFLNTNFHERITRDWYLVCV